MTVFVPITVAGAQELRASGAAHDLIGYADGPALRRWLGEPRLDDEEVDYIALNHAGVATLLLDGSSPRLVLAVAADLAGADELGTVPVPVVRWDDVRSLFADEESASEAVARARAAVAGSELAAALAEPAVERLQEAHDLLWFAPEELDVLS